MILQAAQDKLGWPQPEEIFAPASTVTRLTADLADQKIGRALRILTGDLGVRVGVLSANDDLTEAPMALVCQFPRPATAEVLLEAQRLAWNFSRSLLLITVEPTLIRKWSCYEKPKTTEEVFGNNPLDINTEALDRKSTPQILPRIEFDIQSNTFINENEAFSLSWIDLLSGAFFSRQAKRFRIEERADKVLLDNLNAVREALRALELKDEFSHDLLARIIFVQFLFDRKDSEGRAALDEQKLAQLQMQGILQASYKDIGQLFASYDDTYALFRWLNERFNGDLFPGKGETQQQREEGWQLEQDNVHPQHLDLLAKFVRGDLEIKKGQYCLWRQYAFDAIPLELISSIYEQFVTNAKSAHYTPSHLVDLMLDRVLPWESEDWDIKILDPSCGSGIFLVKAYQRLIHRWKRAHGSGNYSQTEVPSIILRQILENNLFGVDEHKGAIRVASFSLYLAMCDEIDPRHYWSDEDKVNFPALRDRTLIGRDFFAEDTTGFRTKEDAGIYDLVVGNPPWGDATSSHAAKEWMKAHGWKVANNDFGILFAVKAMELTKHSSFICLVQSAGALLYNHSSEARRIQNRIFQNWKKIDCLVNLAVFRPFKNVKVPSCVLVVSNQEPDGSPFWYECPKPSYTPEDKGKITVDSTELHLVYPDELQQEPWIWSTLMWGGSRDRALLQKIQEKSSLATLQQRDLVRIREGVNRGNRTKEQSDLLGRRIFTSTDFPDGHSLSLIADNLPINIDPFIDWNGSTNLDAFHAPQVLLKKSWLKAKNRFQARLVQNDREEGVLCNKSYVSVHDPLPGSMILDAVNLAYNSDWATYFLLLTTGRFAFDRPEVDSGDLIKLPLPLSRKDGTLAPESAARFRALLESDIHDGGVSLEDIDQAVFDAFNFQSAERILIEDLVENTLLNFKWRDQSPSHRPTRRKTQSDTEPDLHRYCETLLRTLVSNYGADKAIAAVVWSETEDETLLPMRYVSIIFDMPYHRGVRIHPLEQRELRERILALYRYTRSQEKETGYSQQIRDYGTYTENGETGFVLHIVKPDWLRYWTRSMALRDADAVVNDFMLWQQASNLGSIDEGNTC